MSSETPTTPQDSEQAARRQLAHDIRGHLSAIVSCVRVMRGGHLPTDQGLDMIERNTRDLLTLVATLLEQPAGDGAAEKKPS